jgi:hypothetical protein
MNDPIDPTLLAVPTPSLGSPRAWARDFALLVHTPLAAFAVLAVWAGDGVALLFTLVIAIVATTLGIAIGGAMPTVLLRWVRRVPLVLLLGASAGLGALWGAASIGAGLSVLGVRWGSALGERYLWLGATLFMLQLAWFWLPYTWLRLRRARTWPLVLAAQGTFVLALWVSDRLVSSGYGW